MDWDEPIQVILFHFCPFYCLCIVSFNVGDVNYMLLLLKNLYHHYRNFRTRSGLGLFTFCYVVQLLLHSTEYDTSPKHITTRNTSTHFHRGGASFENVQSKMLRLSSKWHLRFCQAYRVRNLIEWLMNNYKLNYCHAHIILRNVEAQVAKTFLWIVTLSPNC